MNTIKFFLAAKTPNELIKKMLDNNRKHGTGFVYDSPIPLKNGASWIVWFTANVAEYSKKEMQWHQ